FPVTGVQTCALPIYVRTGGRSATATPVLDRAGTSQWALPAWPRGRAAGEQAGRSHGWNDDGLWVSMAGATPSVEGGALVSDASEDRKSDVQGMTAQA